MATSEDVPAESTQESLTDAELVAKIIKQVEFYFGDKNLPRDKFLLRILHEEGNEQGWVPLETLTIFNRLKLLSTDVPYIVSALKQSTSGLLEINEDNTNVRRKTPIPDIFDGNFFDFSKSVYAKGFPLKSTIDELEKFFESFGQINLISMRKFKGGGFKGSVFVEFSEAEIAVSFAKKEELKFQDTDLLRHMKKDYHEKKAVERQAIKKSHQIEKSEVLRDITKKDKPYLKGAILKLKGVSSSKRFSDLKDFFGEDKQSIDFIHIESDVTECSLMFKTENGAIDAVEKLKTEEGKMKLGENEVLYTLLEGEEGEKEWLRLVEMSNNVFHRGPGGKRDRGRNFGRGSSRGRGKFDRGGRRGNLGKRKYRDRRDKDDGSDSVKNGDNDQSDKPQAKHTRLANSDED